MSRANGLVGRPVTSKLQGWLFSPAFNPVALDEMGS